MVQIAPSMLAADFLHLEKDIDMVNEFADIFHLDIMDGVFVPNLSYGFPVVEAIASKAKKPLDVHLTIVKPENYVKRFAQIGADLISSASLIILGMSGSAFFCKGASILFTGSIFFSSAGGTSSGIVQALL